MGPLLEFLRSHEGSEVEWDEWKAHVIVRSVDQYLGELAHTWVSGCRLFSLHSNDIDPGYQMEVHYLSMRGRTTHLSTRVNEDLPGVKHLSSTGVRAQSQLGCLLSVLSGHGSIVFLKVSAMVLPYSPWQCDQARCSATCG